MPGQPYPHEPTTTADAPTSAAPLAGVGSADAASSATAPGVVAISAQDWAGVLDLVASGGARVAITTASGGVAVLIGAQDLENLQTSSAARLSTADVVLTPREQVVLSRIAAGRSTAQIAAELDLSASTVTAHLATARRKYGVHTSTAAARAAQQAAHLT